MAQEETKEQKIYKLVRDLQQVRKNKRELTQPHNDEIKKISEEIQTILEQQ